MNTFSALIALLLVACLAAQCLAQFGSCTRGGCMYKEEQRNCGATTDKKAFVPYGADKRSKSLLNKVTFEKCQSFRGDDMGYKTIQFKATTVAEGCKVKRMKDMDGKSMPQLICPAVISCCDE